jgi:DNA-directed RNA polymerase specialized sigma subunit
MIYSANTKTFDNIFQNNYKHFIAFSQGNVDNVHNVYLSVRNRIEAIVFTGNSTTEVNDKLYGYIKRSIYWEFLEKQRLKKHEIDVHDCMHQLEYILQRDEAFNEDNRTETQQLEYVTMKLFEYLKLKYTESEQYVFRCYFLYDKDKRLTYSQLAKLTGFSISKVCGIIQRIKADLRLNLINYINNG